MNIIPKDVFFGFVISRDGNTKINQNQSHNIRSETGDMLVQFGRLHFTDQFAFTSLKGLFDATGRQIAGFADACVESFLRVCYDKDVDRYSEAQGILEDMREEALA